MRAIVGCLLLVAGGLYAAQELMLTSWGIAWGLVPVLVGLALLLRNPPARVGAGEVASRCRTCRGAGTVYSDEYNDWRQTGPIKTVRELCPTCQGLSA